MAALKRLFTTVSILTLVAAAGYIGFAQSPTGPATAILFVTQVPIPADFTTVARSSATISGPSTTRRAAATSGSAIPTGR